MASHVQQVHGGTVKKDSDKELDNQVDASMHASASAEKFLKPGKASGSDCITNSAPTKVPRNSIVELSRVVNVILLLGHSPGVCKHARSFRAYFVNLLPG